MDYSWVDLVREVSDGLFHGARGESEGAVVKHALRESESMRGSLDAQVAEHGVRFPAAKQLDDICVDASH